MTDLSLDFDVIPDAHPAVADNVVAMPQTHPVLPPSAVAQWMKFRDALAQSEDGRFIDVDVIERGLASGQYQFHPGREAAMVTEIRTFPNGTKAICVTWATGSAEELIAMAPGVEAQGRMWGCTHALVEGRPGWKRPLKAAGYAPWSETLHKAL